MAKENRLLHRTNKDGEKTQNKQEHGGGVRFRYQ